MKTPLDPRHKKRQHIIEELFALAFANQHSSDKAQQIYDNKQLIDEQIRKAATEFPIDKINKIDLAILRLAVFELLLEKTQPQKVIIDEAIELAKEYGSEKSPAFINGALGNIIAHATS